MISLHGEQLQEASARTSELHQDDDLPFNRSEAEAGMLDGETAITDQNPGFDIDEDDGDWVDDTAAAGEENDDPRDNDDDYVEESVSDLSNDKDAILQDAELAEEERMGAIQDVNSPAIDRIFWLIHLYASADKFLGHGLQSRVGTLIYEELASEEDHHLDPATLLTMMRLLYTSLPQKTPGLRIFFINQFFLNQTPWYHQPQCRCITCRKDMPEAFAAAPQMAIDFLKVAGIAYQRSVDNHLVPQPKRNRLRSTRSPGSAVGARWDLRNLDMHKFG